MNEDPTDVLLEKTAHATDDLWKHMGIGAAAGGLISGGLASMSKRKRETRGEYAKRILSQGLTGVALGAGAGTLPTGLKLLKGKHFVNADMLERMGYKWPGGKGKDPDNIGSIPNKLETDWMKDNPLKGTVRALGTPQRTFMVPFFGSNDEKGVGTDDAAAAISTGLTGTFAIKDLGRYLQDNFGDSASQETLRNLSKSLGVDDMIPEGRMDRRQIGLAIRDRFEHLNDAVSTAVGKKERRAADKALRDFTNTLRSGSGQQTGGRIRRNWWGGAMPSGPAGRDHAARSLQHFITGGDAGLSDQLHTHGLHDLRGYPDTNSSDWKRYRPAMRKRDSLAFIAKYLGSIFGPNAIESIVTSARGGRGSSSEELLQAMDKYKDNEKAMEKLKAPYADDVWRAIEMTYEQWKKEQKANAKKPVPSSPQAYGP
jgi:hypothetical protein